MALGTRNADDPVPEATKTLFDGVTVHVIVELVGGLVKENVLPEAQTASVGGPVIVPVFKGVIDFEVETIQPFGSDMLTEKV